MIYRVDMRKNMAGINNNIPDMMARTASACIPGFFMSLTHIVLHRITLLIGLVVILPVLAGF
jgi:hypothetical protein